MIISDEKYNNLKSKALSLQTALDVNVIDVYLAKAIVNDILNLKLTPQPIQDFISEPTVNNIPQPIPHPIYDRFGKAIKEDMLSPYDTNKLFEDYLRDTYDINKPFIHRWKPEDKLSENDLKEIFNISKDNNFNTSFKNATDIFLSTNRNIDLLDFDTELVINNFYKKYESIYPNLKSIVNEDGPSLDDKFLRTIKYDRNIEGLLDQTNLTRLDIVIFTSPILGSYYEECINWLLKTQGYTKEYLYSKEEVNKSIFLSSLSNALDRIKKEYKSHDHPIELVVLAYTDCFDHAIALGNKKNIVINKSATICFRDPIKYIFFAPDIHLESNIIVDENTPIIDIRFNCSKKPSDHKTFDLKTINTD